jgi:uncharacterized protein YbjT (DUF2867 family)
LGRARVEGVVRVTVTGGVGKLGQWVVRELRDTSNGRHPTRFALSNYRDVRDLAAAFRLAIERTVEGFVALYITADVSSVAEPLKTLLPRFLPAPAELARRLDGAHPRSRTLAPRRCSAGSLGSPGVDGPPGGGELSLPGSC